MATPHDPMFSEPLTPSLQVPFPNSSPNVSDSTSSPAVPAISDSSMLKSFIPLFDASDNVSAGSTTPEPLPLPQEPNIVQPNIVPSLRRSSRTTKPPPYLQNYTCNSIMSTELSQSDPLSKSGTSLVTTRYPLSDYIDNSFLSSSYAHFCSVITSIPEPRFYHEVVKDPKWQEAMSFEIDALVSNNTWTLTPFAFK